MYEIMKRADEFTALGKIKDKLTAFVSLMDEIDRSSTLPSVLIRELFEKTGYRDMLLEEGPIVGGGKVENVEELISAAVEYETRLADTGEEPTLGGFLEEVFLVSDVDKYDETADAVVLMTVHAAKGLEFPIVFIAGMEEGIFPSDKDGDTEDSMAEERRLAYVAITRAKEKLFVTHARERMMYGKTRPGLLSRFVKREIPDSLIERDMPRREPPRMSYYTQPRHSIREPENSFGELRRAPSVSVKPDSKSAKRDYGIARLPSGTRVRHSIFGEGTVKTMRDMGGDVLYEVEFDTVGTKKLMATFAKLERID